MTEQNFAASHYGARADAYVQSQVHASGADLDEMEAFLAESHHHSVLDLGCGGGHVSYRAAKHAGRVVAYDVTPTMLDAVARTAAQKGLANIETSQGTAEALPFDAGSFDAVLCRFTAHHWSDFAAGLREARRVIQPGCSAVFIDTIAPARRVLDSHLQAMELLRDPSHVRNYTLAEWFGALAEAGFAVQRCTVRRLRMEFASWIKRTATPVDAAHAVLRLQQGAPDSVKQYFRIAPEGDFDLEAATIMVKAV